jgi:hypothetical protein
LAVEVDKFCLATKQFPIVICITLEIKLILLINGLSVSCESLKLSHHHGIEAEKYIICP